MNNSYFAISDHPKHI